jgi:16S rRNA (guanine527-N7)-methyltransferase
VTSPIATSSWRRCATDLRGVSRETLPGVTDARAFLDDLAARLALPTGAAASLDALLKVVATDEEAPTTVTAPVEAARVHVQDSLDGLQAAAVREAAAIADLGAGAGFPGLVLAVALPRAHVTLVESAGRKCAFMRRAAEAAGISNADVVHARAEEWVQGLAAQDVVTARALAPLTTLVEYAAPLLRVGGTLVAWKGRRDPAEEADGAAAADETGLSEAEIVRIPPREGADERHLYLYSKVRDTPDRYPRRPGIARKRPIQASGGG